MQYRLDQDHYIDDMLIPAGTIIGDDSGSVAYRYTQDTPDGQGGYFKAGSPRPPSRSMIPLDDEAKKAFHDAFGGVPPERDFTKSIPIQGTGSEAKAPGPGYKRPGTDEQYKKPLVDEPEQKPKIDPIVAHFDSDDPKKAGKAGDDDKSKK